MDDVELDIARDGVKFARRAIAASVLCAAVAVVVCLIDQGIKRAVIDEVGKARAILDEFKQVAQEARDGAKISDQAGAGDSAGVGVDPGLVDDTGAGTVLDQAAGPGSAAPAVSAPGVADGTPRDG